MAETRRITTAVFRAQEEGVEATARKLDGLSTSATRAGQAAETMARSTETSARRLGNIERETEALQKRLAGAPAAWASFEKGAATAGRALDAGKMTVSEYSKAIQQLQQRLQQSIAPKIGVGVDQTGVAAALAGQTKVSAATRATIRDLLRQAEVEQRVAVERAKANDLVAAQVARLRAEIDPLTAAQDRLNAELAQYNAFAAQGAISADELARAQALANDRFNVTAARLGAANDNIRLSTQQVQGLGYQLNDVATMLAMGANPFQIMASQAGQVVQELGNHPGGVRGSLRAMGTQLVGLAASIGPVGLALGAASAAAVGFAYAFRRDFPDMEETLAAHEELIGKITERYKGLRDQIERIGEETSSIGLNIQLGAQQRDLDQLVQQAVQELRQNLVENFEAVYSGAVTLQELDVADELEPIAGIVNELRRDLADGAADVFAFRSALEPMYEVAGDDADMRKAIEAALGLTDKIADLTLKTREAAAAVDALSEKTGRLRLPGAQDQVAPFGGLVPMMERLNPEVFTTLRDGLIDQADAMRDAEASAAEYGVAVADQRAAIQENVASLQRQVDMFGQSEGAIAAAEVRTEMLAEAYRLAADANEVVTPDQIANIEEAASRIGFLTDRLAEMREAAENARQLAAFFSDLDFEIRTAGLSDVDRDIAEAMRRYSVAPGSYDGQQIEAGIRYLDLLDKHRERTEALRDLNRELWGGIAQDIMGGAGALEAVGNALDNLAQKLVGNAVESFADQMLGSFAPGLFKAPTAPAGLDLKALAERGATPIAPMYVSVVSGPLGGAGGAIDRLLNPANGNSVSALDAAGKAIRTMESGSAAGNYSALGPLTRTGDRAYGAYQVMGANIPSWSKAALGRSIGVSDFLANPGLQDQIFAHRFGGYMGKYGPEGAARAWFAGEGGMNRLGASDVLGTSTGGYGSRFGDLFARHGGGTAEVVREMQSAGAALADATGGLGTTANFFASGFDLNSRVMIDGMEGTVSSFLPKFGGNLERLLEAVGGQGGGLGSLLGGGISAGAQAHILANPGGGLWSSGGYTGPGPVHKPAGIVHKGEIVWSQRDIARAGGIGAVEGMRLGLRGYATGGLVQPAPSVTPIARGAPNVSLNVINKGEPMDASVSQRDDGRGGAVLDVVLDRKFAEKVANRGTRTNAAMRQTGGLKSR